MSRTSSACSNRSTPSAAGRASARSNALSVRIELQADCYAGVWANAAQARLQLTDADIKSALDTAARIGDDALQQASRGRVVPDSFTHGSSEQRQRWFYQGFKTATPTRATPSPATTSEAMGKVVNLRTARKQRGRAEARRRAAEAAGRSAADAAEAERLRASAELERRRLEGHHLKIAATSRRRELAGRPEKHSLTLGATAPRSRSSRNSGPPSAPSPPPTAGRSTTSPPRSTPPAAATAASPRRFGCMCSTGTRPAPSGVNLCRFCAKRLDAFQMQRRCFPDLANPC